MIDRTHALPIVRPCQLLKLARSTAYDQPTPVSETELVLRRRLDELHLHHPFAGARMLRDLLRQDGLAMGRRPVATLMRRRALRPCIASHISATDIQPIGSIPLSSATW